MRCLIVAFALLAVGCAASPSPVSPTIRVDVGMGRAAALSAVVPPDVYLGCDGGQCFIDPSLTGSVEQAVAYLQRRSVEILGRRLTQEELDEAGRRVGYVYGEPVTGVMVNAILTLLYAMTL